MRDVAPRAVGGAALFSGVALVTHIVAGASLGLGLLVATSVMALAVGALWRRASASGRRRLARSATVGAGCGALATAAYDLSRFVLSQVDASPYNPFEAIRVFGIGLAGPAAPEALVYGAGSAFHLLNGVSFGIAYCLLFGRRGVLAGVGWGLFLELFQLTLYPGWLDIRAYSEFVQISALAHIAYGAVLGAACRRGLGAGGDGRGEG